MADILKANFSGQVGSPCGCVGCFDQFNLVQGNWQHDQKKKKGKFQSTDYNSLMCGCDGVFNGQTCPGGTVGNSACFSGTGTLNPTGTGKKLTTVAFRTEVEDDGEAGTNDFYRMRIWIPTGAETVKQLAAGACCTNASPTGQAGRAPDIDEGGNLLHGNIQVKPQPQGCPVPAGSCAP